MHEEVIDSTQSVTLGKISFELLESGVDEICASENETRMICWALQRVTGIIAAEHILCGCSAGCSIDGVASGAYPRLVVFERSQPLIAVCIIDIAGPNIGLVQSV